MDKSWNSEKLKFLVEKSHMAVEDIAAALEISHHSLCSYMYGTITPSVIILMKMANYFGVSTDYILGREDNKDVDLNYESAFRRARKGAYEKYLRYRAQCWQGSLAIEDKNMAPIAEWPYNLLEKITGKPIEYALSDDQKNGLIYVLTQTLTAREEKSIRLYFADELTLSQISKEFGIGKERVRQIIAKALRKMKYPTRWNYISYGEKGYALMLEERNLDSKIKALEEKEQMFNDRLAEFNKKQEAYKDVIDVSIKPVEVYDTTISELDLSVRSCNCLTRAASNVKNGYKKYPTIGDVIEACDGKIENVILIRNLGRRSYEEIYNVIKEKTGYTLQELFDNWPKKSA